MDIKEIENEYDVMIIVKENYNEKKDWKYTAFYYDEELEEDYEVAYANTLEQLILDLDEWEMESDDYISDSDWARSIDYGGYDTEDEFWEHLYKF